MFVGKESPRLSSDGNVRKMKESNYSKCSRQLNHQNGINLSNKDPTNFLALQAVEVSPFACALFII